MNPESEKPIDGLDTELAFHLKLVDARVNEEFEGVFSPETIDRFMAESIDQYERSPIKKFVPVMVERFARERLRALAQAEGSIAKEAPEVLFVCTHNAGRSQMAMALMDRHSGGRVHVRSAGSTPADEINLAAVEVMGEIGLDLRKEFPKPLTDEVVRAADVVVMIGCGDTCPIYPGKRYLDWDLDDPAGKTVAEVRPIRDELDRRVQALLAELADDKN
ncbi:MAG: arsenate reductase ArsC [Acidimicrobiia bacterium]